MISFVLSRRCCNEGQVRVLWYMMQAYLAARRSHAHITYYNENIKRQQLFPVEF
jgi:hypothetical protein